MKPVFLALFLACSAPTWHVNRYAEISNFKYEIKNSPRVDNRQFLVRLFASLRLVPGFRKGFTKIELRGGADF